MSTVKIGYGTAASLTFSGLNGLAAGSSVLSSAVDNSSTLALDYGVEITIADFSESGNAQALVYAVSSVDGTNFSDNSNGSNRRAVGFLDLTGTGPHRMPLAAVAAAFGGVCPKYFKVGVTNDAGAAFPGSGCSGQVVPINYTSA